MTRLTTDNETCTDFAFLAPWPPKKQIWTTCNLLSWHKRINVSINNKKIKIKQFTANSKTLMMS